MCIVALVLRRETVVKYCLYKPVLELAYMVACDCLCSFWKHFFPTCCTVFPCIFKEMYFPGLQVHFGYVDIYLLIYLLLINSQVDQYCGLLFCLVFSFSFFFFFFAKNCFFPFVSSYVPSHLESVTCGAYTLLEADWVCWESEVTCFLLQMMRKLI